MKRVPSGVPSARFTYDPLRARPGAWAPVRRNSQVAKPMTWLIAGSTTVMLALLLGLVAASGSARFALVFGGAIVGLALLFASAGQLLVILTVLSFYIVGQVFYFADIGQALWLPYGIALVFFAKWLASMFVQSTKTQVDAITMLIALFLLCVCFSTLLNGPNALQAAATGKNFIAMWGVFFVMAAALVPVSAVHQMWRLLWWALIFQLPIVVYQYLVVAPSRRVFGGVIGGVEWDAVVGGFGGHREGGGSSGAMAYFVCLMFVYALARHRHKLASATTVVVTGFAGLICVALAEVKVAVVLLPLAVLVFLAPQLSRRPLLVISSALAVLAMGLALLVAYQAIHYNRHLPTAEGPVAVLDRAFGYSLDPERINMRTGEMGRMAAVVHWVREAPRDGPAYVLFGYGMGASRSQSLAGAGDVALRYPIKIDRSSAVQILWDIGLVGFLFLMSALLLGAWRAAILARRLRSVPEMATYLDTASVGLATIAVMMFYGRDPFDVPALALLSAVMLGLVSWHWRLRSSHAASRPGALPTTAEWSSKAG